MSYHYHIILNNDCPDTEIQEPINSPQLSYAENVEVDELVRKVTNLNSGNNCQYICNKNPALKRASKPNENMFNV